MLDSGRVVVCLMHPLLLLQLLHHPALHPLLTLDDHVAPGVDLVVAPGSYKVVRF